MENALQRELSEKLDVAIALLKIIAKKDIDSLKKSILSTSKKERIFELCNGSTEPAEIAKEVNVSGEYVRLTLKELEEAGLIIMKQVGGKRVPVRMV